MKAKLQQVTSALANKDNYVEVEIRGLTVFYLEKDARGDYINPMLLIVKDDNHDAKIVLTPTDEKELYNAIGESDCASSACKIGNYRIRVTEDGTPLTGTFTIPNDSFDRRVVHLTDGNPNFTDFTDDAKDVTEPPKGTILAALDLRGATVQQVTRFPCLAKFDAGVCNAAGGQFQEFASMVKLRFKNVAKPKLEFLVKKGDARLVSFTDPNPQKMELDNLSTKAGSHMHLLEKLSKTGKCLPKVVQGPCLGPNLSSDYVPGCGNTQWP